VCVCVCVSKRYNTEHCPRPVTLTVCTTWPAVQRNTNAPARSPPSVQPEALWSAFTLLTLLLALYITEQKTVIRLLNTWHRTLFSALTQYRSAIREWTLALLWNMLLLIVTELAAVQYSINTAAGGCLLPNCLELYLEVLSSNPGYPHTFHSVSPCNTLKYITAPWISIYVQKRYLLLTHLLTYSWSRVLPEKLTGPQLVKKFSALFGTRRFISAFKTAPLLSQINRIHAPHPTSWRSIMLFAKY